MATTESLTVYPQAYDTSASSFRSISGETNPVGKGSTNTSYAQIIPTNGGRVASYVYWPFDLSAIPENATIDSVSCSVAARMSSVSGASILTAPIQLFAGSVAKGSATDVYSRLSADPFSLSTGTWTRAELKTCRLKTGITRNTSNTSSTTYKLYFYGADLTVTYTYQSEKFMLKLGGSWTDVARVFKKVSGIWVEQTELASVIEDGVRYKNGGEIISPKKTVTIIGDGGSYASVTIDGVKYTSAAKVSVPSGTPITLAATGTSAGGGSGTIFVDSNDTPVKTGLNQTYQHTVTNHVLVMIHNQVLSGYVAASMCIMVTGVSSNILSCNLFISGSTFAYPIPFEAGMTWAEMISSRYNIIAECSISGNQVVLVDSTSGSVVAYISGVTPSDVIEADKDYQAITI